MIVGLSGYARAGKDTAATALVMDGWQRAAFADKLRALALATDPMITNEFSLSAVVRDHGWEHAKDIYPEVRRTLQALGQGVRDVLGANTWVHALIDSLDRRTDWVITDVRYPNEAQAIVDAGGRIVRIVRPGHGPVNGHASETALDDWPFDTVILNDSTLEQLARNIRAFVA